MNGRARITTQKEMSVRNRSMQFCYLCGAMLTKESQTEHVVPRKLLGPAKCRSPFPVTLRVHTACDREAKQKNDHAIQLLHKIQTRPVESWPIHHLAALPIRAEVANLDATRTEQRVFKGIDVLLEGVVDWVRGFHAALYDEYLEREGVVVFPPVPAANLRAGIDFDEVRRRSELIRMVVTTGARTDRWDGVIAWCDELRYWGVWYDSRLEGDGRWTCFWELVHPGVYDWKVPDWANATPWHGMYFADCPRRASILTQRKIDQFDEMQQASGEGVE